VLFLLLFHAAEDRVYTVGHVMTLVTGACWGHVISFFQRYLLTSLKHTLLLLWLSLYITSVYTASRKIFGSTKDKITGMEKT